LKLGDLSEFPLKYRLFLKTYPWRRIDPVPWAAMKKPLKDCRVAVISSAGLVGPGQEPFDDSIRGGDFSFREIPDDTEVSTLADTHRSDLYDHAGIRQDPNLAFPLDRLRELVRSGRIGSLNRRHLSFMGSITAPGRLVKKTAPSAVRGLVKDGVDIALLVPV
jgi:D-proline reductase (dithiol) PrdB